MDFVKTDLVPHAFLSVMLPQLLECRVYLLTGKQTNVNTKRRGIVCALSGMVYGEETDKQWRT